MLRDSPKDRIKRTTTTFRLTEPPHSESEEANLVLLNQALITEAKVVIVSYDYVVQHVYSKNIPKKDDVSCQLLVFFAWSGVT